MAVYNPLRKRLQRVAALAHPPSTVLTGDAVSRAAAMIEEELDGSDILVKSPGGKGFVVDEIRIYGEGREIARHRVPRMAVLPGQRATISDISLDIS